MHNVTYSWKAIFANPKFIRFIGNAFRDLTLNISQYTLYTISLFLFAHATFATGIYEGVCIIQKYLNKTVLFDIECIPPQSPSECQKAYTKRTLDHVRAMNENQPTTCAYLWINAASLKVNVYNQIIWFVYPIYFICILLLYYTPAGENY